MVIRPGHAIAAAALLLGICVLLYLPGLSGPLLLDDYQQLLPLAQDRNLAEGSWRLYFASTSGPTGRPVAMGTFVINALVSGTDFQDWKATNLAIHLITAAFVYLLVARLAQQLGSFAAQQRTLFAMAITGLWLLHPLQVSTVLYTVQRMSQLAALFVVAGLLCYVEARRRQIAGQRAAWIFMASCYLVCMPLAVMSKENGLLLPLLTLLLEAFFFRFRGSSAVHRTLICGYAACGALALCVVMLSFHADSLLLRGYAFRDFSLLERLLTESRVLNSYLVQLVWPAPSQLSFFYDDIQVSRALFDPPGTLFSIAFLALLLAIVFSQRDTFPLAGFGVAFFFAAHALESSLPPLELVFEHRNYLPSIGLCIVVVAVLARACSPPLCLAVLATFLLSLSLLTAKRVQVWSAEATLYEFFVAVRPGSARAALLLAEYHRVNGAHAEALATLAGHQNLAVDLQRRVIECNRDGQLPADALQRLSGSIGEVIHARHVDALVELGHAALAGHCKFSTAAYVALLDTALAARSSDEAARHTLMVYKARFLHKDGKIAEAIEILGQAHQAWPDEPFPLMLAAEWYIDQGDRNAAIRYLARAESYSIVRKLRYQAVLAWLRDSVRRDDGPVR